MSDAISILDGFPIGQKFSQALVKLSPLSCGEHRPAMGSGISEVFPPWITIMVGYFTGFVVLLHKHSFFEVSEKMVILMTDFKGFG